MREKNKRSAFILVLLIVVFISAPALILIFIPLVDCIHCHGIGRYELDEREQARVVAEKRGIIGFTGPSRFKCDICAGTGRMTLIERATWEPMVGLTVYETRSMKQLAPFILEVRQADP